MMGYPVNVTLACPSCDRPSKAPVDQPGDWQCYACDHRLRLAAAEKSLPGCVVCGNHELYKKKDFPQWLGGTILLAAVVLSTVTYYSYEKWWSWSFLIGSAHGPLRLFEPSSLTPTPFAAKFNSLLARSR